MNMENLFLILGIVYFVTQIIFVGVAVRRDITNIRLNNKAVENQKKILDTYDWTVNWVKEAEKRIYAIRLDIDVLRQTKEEKK
jgi:hypothetical protein